MAGTLRLVNTGGSNGQTTVTAAGTADRTINLPDEGGTLLINSGTTEHVLPSGTVGSPGLAIVDDLDTGIYSPAANTIAITTSGTQRLEVDAAGNVGIGTSSPDTLLDLEGTPAATTGGILRIRDTQTTTSAGKGGIHFSSSPGIDFYIAKNYDPAQTPTVGLDFGNATSGASIMRLTANGLGVGTATGVGKLTVFTSTTYTPGNNYNDGCFLIGNGTATTGNFAISYDNTNGAALTSLVPSVAWKDISYGANQHIFGIGGSERVRIDNSGRLLVGTTTNRIVGGSVGAKAQIEYAGGSGFNGLSVSATDGGATFYINNASSTTVAADALVGRLGFTGYDGTDCRNQFAKIETYADGTVSGDDVPGRLVFSTTADGASSPTERMRITNSGTVSYNSATIAHGALFAATNGANTNWVFGPNTTSAYVVYNSAGSGVYLTSGNTSWTGSSDERLKTDLTPIENGLSKVGTLRAVTGRFKTDENSVSRSFLIAQDVQTVLPEAVDATDENALGLRYTEVIPLLVAALKESKGRIEALEAKVAALEAN